MFIDAGDMVTISEGHPVAHLRGRFGRVVKIRVVSHTKDVMVFVEVFNPETGGDDLMMFGPADIDKRRNQATAAKRTRRDAFDHHVAFDAIAKAA